MIAKIPVEADPELIEAIDHAVWCIDVQIDFASERLPLMRAELEKYRRDLLLLSVDLKLAATRASREERRKALKVVK